MKTFNNLEECIKEIKRLRIQVDSLIQTGQGEWMKETYETRQALNNLMIAKAWLGKLLGDITKSASPYPEVWKAEEIVPTQDTAEVIKFESTTPEQLGMCNSQRRIIDQAIESFRDLWYPPNLEMLITHHNDEVGFPKDEEDIKRVQAEGIYTHYDYFNLIQEHLQQARFWYGFEIANLRTI